MNTQLTDQFFYHFPMLAEYLPNNNNNDSCCLYVLEASEGERMICTDQGTAYRWFDKDSRLSEELDIVKHLTQYTGNAVQIKEVTFL